MNLLRLSRLRTAGKLVLALARGYEKAALTLMQGKRGLILNQKEREQTAKVSDFRESNPGRDPKIP